MQFCHFLGVSPCPRPTASGNIETCLMETVIHPIICMLETWFAYQQIHIDSGNILIYQPGLQHAYYGMYDRFHEACLNIARGRRPRARAEYSTITRKRVHFGGCLAGPMQQKICLALLIMNCLHNEDSYKLGFMWYLECLTQPKFWDPFRAVWHPPCRGQNVWQGLFR